MRQVEIQRIETGDTGTFGILTTDSGFSCYTGELPWEKNKPGKSCIPEGVYVCKQARSPKHGLCYYVTDVPGRTDIEIHAANWMGDKSKGLKCQLEGCIAPGRAIMDIIGQRGMSSSRDALQALEADLDGEPFQLTIRWRKDIAPKA